ncbi:hypothetical protein [Streptomyces sp. AcH 505]|uniref:hypothetical protein n=1 Tax=Streptomyces sp. AcH 505 TaxID=352211 RepID=UPI0018E3A285
MADIAAWVGGIGGAIGAVSGPTAVWAAWRQHALERRMQNAPPVEVGAHLLVLIRIATDATLTYRDAAWWRASGGEEATNALRQLEPMIQGLDVRSNLVNVLSGYLVASSTLASPDMGTEQRMSAVASQATRAKDLETRARQALESWRKAS